MIAGNKIFDRNHTYIMGILNVTPDSFSDGGQSLNIDDALFLCEKYLNEGADIIDVGGMSTRPGFSDISKEEELSRVIPVIEAINKNFDTVISLDTFKPAVASEGLKAGAVLINSVMDIKDTNELILLCAKEKASLCLTFNRQIEGDPVSCAKAYFKEAVSAADTAGVALDRIMLDPGIGFNKDTTQNLYILKNLSTLNELGYPILLGASRKSVIGNVLDVPVDKRLAGTLATTAAAVFAGCNFVRVHDVLENRQLIKMLEEIRDA